MLQFPVVRQRRLELTFLIGIELAYLMSPGLSCELNTLLLRLLHKSGTGAFRQCHGDLFCLSIELLGILLPFTERIFTLHIEQAGIRIRQQIAGNLTELQRCILCLGNICPLLGLGKNARAFGLPAPAHHRYWAVQMPEIQETGIRGFLPGDR
jgi:hypothetical protein